MAGEEAGGAMVPADKGHLAYLIFFWLGAGFLLPWNAFITAVDYFLDLYPNAHIDYVFSVSYMLPNLVMLILLMICGRHYTSTSRISLGFVLFLCLIVLIPILDVLTIKGGQGNQLSLELTVLAVASTGAIDAVIQGSLFGMAGELPERYTQALVGGTSASGVIISFARILTKAALPNTRDGLRLSANIYFTISALFLAMCIVGFQILKDLPIVKYYQQLKHTAAGDALRENEGPSAGPETTPLVHPPGMGGMNRDSSSTKDLPLLEKFFNSQVLTVEGRAMALHTDSQVDYMAVFAQIWPYPCTLTLIYIVTLSIFPGFISEGVDSPALGSWYPVMLMTIFNIGDFSGKMTPTIWTVTDAKLLALGTVLRLLFYPVYGFCISGPSILRTELPITFLTLALGFTNGIYTGWLMMAAPAKVSLRESEAAGFIMVLFLVLGLFFGALAGWAWLLFV